MPKYMGNIEDNPEKRWCCDACFTVYKATTLWKTKGTCPECGCTDFHEADSSEPTWIIEEK